MPGQTIQNKGGGLGLQPDGCGGAIRLPGVAVGGRLVQKGTRALAVLCRTSIGWGGGSGGVAALPCPPTAAAAATAARPGFRCHCSMPTLPLLACCRASHVHETPPVACRDVNARSETMDRIGFAVAAVLLGTFLVFAIALREELPGVPCADQLAGQGALSQMLAYLAA